MLDHSHPYQFQLPSRLGSEKTAMAIVASYAAHFGLNDETVQDIKTLVSEACLNAMEHGNDFNEDDFYAVEVMARAGRLIIRVCDSGRSRSSAESEPLGHLRLPESTANVERDIADMMASDGDTRGWGMTIINHLADHWHFDCSAGRTCLEMEVTLPS